MAPQVNTNNKSVLHPPSFYSPDDTNISHAKKDALIIRIFYAVLPFIALHRPFGKGITLIMDSIRTFSIFNDLTKKKDSKKLLKTIVAIIGLVGTIFMHPVGLCISTLNDLGYDITGIITQLQIGNNQQVFYSILSMMQHFFYLGIMLVNSLEIIVISILLSMAIEICRSKKEFQKGNFLEGLSHLLMSLVRFCQSMPFIEKVAYKHNIEGKENCKNLTNTIEKIKDRLSIFFYSTARFFVNPHWKITSKWIDTVSLYKNSNTPLKQKIFSTTNSIFSSIALLPFALGGLFIGQICHFSAHLLSTKPYIHLKNQMLSKIPDKKLSFFQLNCCLTSGGFSRLFGGTLLSNDERVLKIAEIIKKNDPDLVCLQEVSDLKDAFNLYKKLSDNYSDFYFNMGSTPFILQNNSGLFVASKVDIKNPKLHSFSDIKGTESMVNKCFFIFSTDVANFITTHLSPSKDDLTPTKKEINTRMQEQERIFSTAKQRFLKNNKPTFISGDFNINWNSNEYKESLLFTEGKDKYNQNRKEVSTQQTAETEYLINRNWKYDKNTKPQHLILDYFLSLFDSKFSASHKTDKISTFDINEPEKAISDHAALMSEISL